MEVGFKRSPDFQAFRAAVMVVCLLTTHALLLMWGAWQHSPTWDEVAHLPAGLSHWQHGRFDLYRVNPPFVRMIAAVPVVLSPPVYEWKSYSDQAGSRAEFPVGRDFVNANGAKSFWYFTIARWACIPFSLLGGYVCYRWGRELYGNAAAVLALALWCFCPNILAHGQLITPDVGATACGVLAGYLFWRWLKQPCWSTAVVAGIALGVVELTKFTWIVLFPLWPMLWIVWRWCEQCSPLAEREARPPLAEREGYTEDAATNGEDSLTLPSPKRRGTHPLAEREGYGENAATRGEDSLTVPSPSGRWNTSWLRQGLQLAVILLLGLFVINLGYGFEGSFTKLGDYQFISQSLAGQAEAGADWGTEGNRFAGTWWGNIPVPAPRNYLSGIDVQKSDFERRSPSYLAGQWRSIGWWYYYLYALAIKVPLGTSGLVLLAAFYSWRYREYSAQYSRHAPCADSVDLSLRERSRISRSEMPTLRWRDEMILLAPALVVLALVSSQTGFNHHFRYVLPIFPFVFIGASRVARSIELRHWKVAVVAGGALLWSVVSSLSVYPHSLSYFNELVGGPRGGPAHLLDSNIDWGQDLLYLKRWVDKHPEAQPLGVAYFVPLVDPRVAGIEWTPVPPGPDGQGNQLHSPNHWGPRPGWYAISVNKMRWHTKEYAYFLRFEPVAMAGYSMYIYHISLEDANRVRRELGLPELEASELTDREPNHD